MKKLKSLIILFLLIGFSQHSEAQFFKKLGEHAKKKIEQEAENRSERRVDKAIDKGFDETEETIDGKNKKKKKKSKKSKKSQKASQDKNAQKATKSKDKVKSQKAKPTVVWSKFDFIPGDTVIFEDMPSSDEENGEFPSRWDLKSGQVEIAEVDGEQVIMFVDGGTIVPFLKDNKQDYLPEVFTVEFDFYTPKKGNRIDLHLRDVKNQGYPAQEITITPIRVDVDKISVDHSSRDYTYCEDGCWTHVSVAYTKGKLKVYIDDTRLINIPHYEHNPSGITLQAYFADASKNKAFYFKNIRIAKGGVKYYDRVLSEGKIIVNGIKFDINKASLKPESMGPINKIYKLMVKNPDVNFSVEGHTDSDGSDETNMTLSKARGKAVMDKLIAMGIDKSRLKSNGFGESKPIDNNASPEGKANNRRVEFVKF
jgi:outer membrane protein OmpA-like peptidoglycan-associated protein